MAYESLVDDEGLLGAARRGDRGAFIVLARAHQRMVYRVVFSVLRDRELSRRVAIEALMRAWRGIANAPETLPFPIWIARLAHHSAIAQQRRSHASAPAFSAEALPGAHPAARERCEAAWAALTPEHQQALSLRLVAHMSYAEIARVLDVPIAVAVSRISGARAGMLSRLGGPELLE